MCCRIPRRRRRRTAPIFPPVKRRYIISPKRPKQTIWSTALGLHLDSIEEENYSESEIRDR